MRVEYVLGGFDERGALFEQAVASPCAGIERRAGYGHHLAALLQREAGGDEAAGALGGLDDGGEREAGDDAVAFREVARLARHSRAGLSETSVTALGELGVEPVVLGRIDLVDAACDGGDRAGVHRCSVSFAIDAARHAGDDDVACLGQVSREIARHAAARRRRHLARRPGRWTGG